MDHREVKLDGGGMDWLKAIRLMMEPNDVRMSFFMVEVP
jgi:hypothetical protein